MISWVFLLSFSVAVNTLDFDSSSPGSNPGRTTNIVESPNGMALAFEASWRNSIVGSTPTSTTKIALWYMGLLYLSLKQMSLVRVQVGQQIVEWSNGRTTLSEGVRYGFESYFRINVWCFFTLKFKYILKNNYIVWDGTEKI